MNAYLGTVFLAGKREDLAKAAKRGKDFSVDRMLRSKLGRTAESRLRGVFQQWRATVKRRILAAYRSVSKDAAADMVRRILRNIELEGFSVDAIEELTPYIRRAFREAGIRALAEAHFDSTPDIVNQVDVKATAYASARAADLVTEITETTRENLRLLVASAVEEGTTVDELSDAIEGIFGFSDSRSDMIARTELAYAHVGGNLEGYRASGVVDRKKWIVAQDNVCDLCAALDGVVVDLDEDFPDAEDGPPLHPNCRCDVVPVLIDEED